MEWNFKILRNTVSGDGHNTLEEAFEYYKETLTEYGYELGISENGVHTIQSLEELCDILNELDIYGCGSSFKIEEWNGEYGKE